LPTFNTILLKPDGRLSTAFSDLYFFVSFFKFVHWPSHAWNFTIDDGLELELDNMMTSFVRSAPPSLCPYTDSVQLHSIDSLPLLACLPLLGVVVQMTRHCPNLASAVHKTLCRRRLHCQSQFLHGARLLVASPMIFKAPRF
jgi:hypothetical protein